MVHGYYTKVIRTEPLPPAPCPNCEDTMHLQAVVLCRVNHIMFIPFTASKKRAAIRCSLCGTFYEPDAFPAYAVQARELAANTRYKWYHFTALAAILLFMGAVAALVIAGSRERNDLLQKELEELHAGNVIFYRTGSKENTCMKVDAVSNDTVFVFENKLTTNKDAYSLDEDNNYSTKRTVLLKKELKQMLDDGTIRNIY